MKRTIDEVATDPGVSDNLSQKKGRTARNTRSNPMSCNVCDMAVSLETNDSIFCPNCQKTFHMNCAGISSQFLLEQFKKVKWICVKCNYATLNLVTSIDSTVDSISDGLERVTQSVAELKTITSSYELLVKNLTIRMETVEEQVKQLMATPCNCNVNEMKEAIDAMKAEISELKKGKTLPPTVLQKQEEQINYLRSQQRRNNLIITGIPEIPNENEKTLMHMISRIGNACGTVVVPPSICEVHRIKKKGSINEATDKKRPPAIFVRFTDNNKVKDDLFFNYLALIARNSPLTCKMVGINANNRIFINQHMSNSLLLVKDKAVYLKKLGIVQKVTARYNFVKISLNNNWHKIHDILQLRQIILKECKQDMDVLITHQLAGNQMETF